MFHNIDDEQVLFDEYRPSKEKLNSFRRRLLAVEPNLLIADNEEEGAEQDWNDIYFIMPNEDKVICLIPNHFEINIPQIFVLTDEKDYEMSDDEIFSFLSHIYDKQLNYKLSDKNYTTVDELFGLVFYIKFYLEHKNFEPELEIVNSYDNYHTGEKKRNYDTPEVNTEEVLKYVKIVLATVYNYKGGYKDLEKDLYNFL